MLDRGKRRGQIWRPRQVGTKQCAYQGANDSEGCCTEAPPSVSLRQALLKPELLMQLPRREPAGPLLLSKDVLIRSGLPAGLPDRELRVRLGHELPRRDADEAFDKRFVLWVWR